MSNISIGVKIRIVINLEGKSQSPITHLVLSPPRRRGHNIITPIVSVA